MSPPPEEGSWDVVLIGRGQSPGVARLTAGWASWQGTQGGLRWGKAVGNDLVREDTPAARSPGASSVAHPEGKGMGPSRGGQRSAPPPSLAWPKPRAPPPSLALSWAQGDCWVAGGGGHAGPRANTVDWLPGWKSHLLNCLPTAGVDRGPLPGCGWPQLLTQGEHQNFM